jgi:hypothetical protein
LKEEQMDDKSVNPVELRLAQEDAGHPRSDELTLDDITLVRRIGNDVERYTGEVIARLIDVTDKGHGEHEAYESNAAIVLDLMGLADVQAALSHVSHEGDFAIHEAMYYVSTFRRGSRSAAARVWSIP